MNPWKEEIESISSEKDSSLQKYSKYTRVHSQKNSLYSINRINDSDSYSSGNESSYTHSSGSEEDHHGLLSFENGLNNKDIPSAETIEFFYENGSAADAIEFIRQGDIALLAVIMLNPAIKQKINDSIKYSYTQSLDFDEEDNFYSEKEITIETTMLDMAISCAQYECAYFLMKLGATSSDSNFEFPKDETLQKKFTEIENYMESMDLSVLFALAEDEKNLILLTLTLHNPEVINGINKIEQNSGKNSLATAKESNSYSIISLLKAVGAKAMMRAPKKDPCLYDSDCEVSYPAFDTPKKGTYFSLSSPEKVLSAPTTPNKEKEDSIFSSNNFNPSFSAGYKSHINNNNKENKRNWSVNSRVCKKLF